MAINPETVITDRLRLEVERAGGYSIKLSDRFTRGIPDLIVVMSRVMLIEVKVFRRGTTQVSTWKRLGLTGLQDQRIRETWRRASRSAYVVTGTLDGPLTLWRPMLPEASGIDGTPESHYMALYEGHGIVGAML